MTKTETFPTVTEARRWLARNNWYFARYSPLAEFSLSKNPGATEIYHHESGTMSASFFPGRFGKPSRVVYS